MDLNIEISKDGYRIFSVNLEGKKKYLGDRYNQKREIEKFVNKIGEKTEKDNYIVFGLFFGEHIKELLKTSCFENKILIVEHNQDIINFCRNDKEVEQILNNPRVYIASSDTDIEQFFQRYINEMNVANLKIEDYCSYYNLYRNCLNDKYELIKKEIARITINRNTIFETCDIVFDNFLRNLKYIAKSTPINVLKDKYKGVPAVIVSAGPSLNKNINYLKENGRRLVLSGGRTLRALIEKNIIPNCVSSVDFGDIAFRLVEGYLNKFDVPLVASYKTSFKIFEEHNGNKFFFSESEFLNEIWNEEIEILFGGGSVAHALTLLAVYMGCDPIVFIGQDLAYTGEKVHDVLADNEWEKFESENLLKNYSDIYVPDINGKPIRTSVALNDFRFSFEKIIKENPNTTFINATEGGANINGAINKRLKDVINEFKEGSAESFNSYSNNVDKTQEIIKKLEETNKIIKECIDLCEEGIKISKEWKINYIIKNSIKFRECECKLNKLDKKINNNLKYTTIINTILKKAIYDVDNNEKLIIKSSDNLDVKLCKKIDKAYELYSQIRKVFEISYKKIEYSIDILTCDVI